MVALQFILAAAFASGAVAKNSAQADLIDAKQATSISAAVCTKFKRDPKVKIATFKASGERVVKDLKHGAGDPDITVCDAIATDYTRYTEALDVFAPRFIGIACDSRFSNDDDRAKVVEIYQETRENLEALSRTISSPCANEAAQNNANTLKNVARIDEIIAAYQPIQLNCLFSQ